MQRVQNGQIIDKIGMDEIEEVIHAETDEEAQASSALDRCSSLEHCPSLSTQSVQLCTCLKLILDKWQWPRNKCQPCWPKVSRK